MGHSAMWNLLLNTRQYNFHSYPLSRVSLYIVSVGWKRMDAAEGCARVLCECAGSVFRGQ
eukprot:3547033-Rhodomonas_salina.1